MRYQITFRQMLDDSRAILTRPSVATFDRYGRGGDALAAAKYVGAAALLGALLGWLIRVALTGSTGNLFVVLVNTATGAIDVLLGFFFFVFLVHLIGQYQGGMGSFDGLAYAFALFVAPISVIVLALELLLPVLVPNGLALARLVRVAEIVLWAVFAWLAIRSVLRMRDNRSILITLGGAVLAMIVLRLIFGGLALG